MPKTISEAVFETYLSARNYGPVRYEELPEGIKRPVDYSIDLGGRTCRFEVKEWEPTEPVAGVRAFDPYEPIRGKIREAKKKFQEYKGRGEACCLVLYHFGPQLIMLDELTIFGAMRGDVGWIFPLDLGCRAPPVIADEGHSAFLRDGEMVRRKNRTISAIVVASIIDPRHREVSLEMARKERDGGKSFEDEQRWEVLEALYEAAGPERAEYTVAVYDNVEATVELPAAFPDGPWDQRFGRKGNTIGRTFVGASRRAIEEREDSLELKRDDPLGIRRR